MKHIYKCETCKKYTMKEICECGRKTSSIKPLKFSPQDGLSSYRRQAKKEEYEKRGLI